MRCIATPWSRAITFRRMRRPTARRSIPRSRSRATCRALHGPQLLRGMEPACGYRRCSRKTGVDPQGEMVHRRGRRPANHESQHPHDQGLGRRGLIALYQNGEAINPANGYSDAPACCPGYEGNMNVKWLRRIKLVEVAGHGDQRDQAIHDPAAGRQSLAVLLPAGGQVPSSRIPRRGVGMKGGGLLRDLRPRLFRQRPHQPGRCVRRRPGKSWAQAALQDPVLSKAFTRFRIAWNWGWPGRSSLQSRAVRRGRQHPADPRGPLLPSAVRPAGHAETWRRSPWSIATPITSWGDRGQRRGGSCLRVTRSRYAICRSRLGRERRQCR